MRRPILLFAAISFVQINGFVCMAENLTNPAFTIRAMRNFDQGPEDFSQMQSDRSPNGNIVWVGKQVLLDESFIHEVVVRPLPVPSEKEIKDLQEKAPSWAQSQEQFAELRKPKGDVDIKLNELGKKKFADITGSNTRKTLVVTLNGRIISLPLVAECITSGTLSLNYPLEEANQIAEEIRTILSSKTARNIARDLSETSGAVSPNPR